MLYDECVSICHFDKGEITLEFLQRIEIYVAESRVISPFGRNDNIAYKFICLNIARGFNHGTQRKKYIIMICFPRLKPQAIFYSFFKIPFSTLSLIKPSA